MEQKMKVYSYYSVINIHVLDIYNAQNKSLNTDDNKISYIYYKRVRNF